MREGVGGLMGKLRWYKRDPVAALEGMSNLSLEEVGAYNIVLDLIYARDGKVDDDDRFIAGWMRCDIRVWRRIRKRLLDCGKLYSSAGSLHNTRADDEVLSALSRVASVSEANSSKGRKSGEARRKNKEIAEPQPEPKANTTTTTTRKTSSLRSEEPERGEGWAFEVAIQAKAKVAVRLAEDWEPSVPDLAFAKANGLDPAAVLRESTKFKNYWLAKGGKDARKLDWSRTWQNWVLNSGGSGGQGRPRTFQNDELSVSRALREQRESGGVVIGARPSLLPATGGDDLRVLPPRRSAES
jgi:uncharacterized protein YdaU (DUF1376 family)